MPDLVRLNKHLAHSLGISRREADKKIEQGSVTLNGKIATLGNLVRPGRDAVEVHHDIVVPIGKRYTYVLLNKPTGYVCSRKQQGETPTIYALLPRHYQQLKVAGRLDKDSCGLVLLTDDGDTIFRLTHPKFGKQKVYHVALNKPLKPTDEKKIKAGITLEDGVSKLAVSAISANTRTPKKPNLYQVTMFEGRNRQIRRTFKHLGYSVTHLERQSFDKYSLKQLAGKPYLQIST